jgi:hypothetical protein
MRKGAVVIAMWLGMAGCDDTLFGVAGEGPGTSELPEQTGYAGVTEIASTQCMPCHSAEQATYGLDLETDVHAATVGVTGAYGVVLVAAGSPDDSLLYTKMVGTQLPEHGAIMPPSGALADSFTDIVRDWIADGALAE